MTVSAAHSSAFIKACSKKEPLFTFTENGEYLVYKVRNEEVIPFWSSKTRLEKIQEHFPKYKNYSIATLDFESYIRLLKQMKADNILVGVNWSGTKMTGYHIKIDDLEKMIEAHT